MGLTICEDNLPRRFSCENGQVRMDDETVDKRSRVRWGRIVVVVAVLAVVIAGGAYVYHTKHQKALASCRQAVAEFSSARKSILDTSENSGELQKLLRNVLGVDNILDAFSDAASSAESTVDTEGCSPNATITQLNLVAKTLNSATDSLNESLKNIRNEIGSSESSSASESDSTASGTSNGGTSSGTESSTDGTSSANGSESNDESNGEDVEQSLRESIDKGKKLVEDLQDDESLTLTGRKLLAVLSNALDAAQQLIDDSGVTDSKYYKAAKVTLDEAINMADNWVNSQSSKS